MPGPVVLFDGVCNLCNGAVNFIIDHDPDRRFRFASLQSEVGSELARSVGLDPTSLETFILVDGGRGYTRSAAALRIAAGLRGPVRLVAALRVIPAFVRDPLYSFVARNRYRWFGVREMCRMPTPEDRARFLE
ncbi:MAG: thiol-disulfide oxidoreductase DCC family protein [Myxococcales bacterium]|nr:thiol-disulfide oxidoreductase DCC family protein [Myxococcales bacterium]MCB9521071.1 thiol-disulfide oxidoreductase DCC family protein [Myxococcales bacterium]